MTTPVNQNTRNIWSAIEDEKRRDRFIRRVSIAAWSVTFALLLVLGVLVGVTEAQTVKAMWGNGVPWMMLYGFALPFIIIVGIVFLLIATLSTVGVFLRMRTTTLGEIQLRLAALEQMLATRKDGE